MPTESISLSSAWTRKTGQLPSTSTQRQAPKTLAYESVTLYKEELDENLAPVEELANLCYPLTILTAQYEDESGSDWLLGIAVDGETQKWLHAYYNFRQR